MELLEGTEAAKESGEKSEMVEVQEDDMLELSKIRRAIKRMKIKKASRVDGIPMKAWKFAGNVLWKRLVKLIKQIWKEGIHYLLEQEYNSVIV